jgi:hypothetical protein
VPPTDPGITMGVLQDFERRLEGAVEGFFARAFSSGVQPIELAKAVQRYAEDSQHVTADGVVVPNVYRLSVSRKDHDRLAGFGRSLPRELAEVIVRTAAERGWSLRGPVKVRIDVDDEVRYGRYALTGRVEVVDDQPAAPPPGRRDEPVGAGPTNLGTPAPSAPGSRPPLQRTQVVPTIPGAGLQLVASSGDDAGSSAPVRGSRVTMGRLASCTLTLSDSTVSREHAALVRRGDRWWVVDLGSTNGTRVNGVQAAEQPVAAGDRIELGDAVVELVEG